jgi:hypothetical protein
MATAIKAGFTFQQARADVRYLLKADDHKGLREILRQALAHHYIDADCSAKAMSLTSKAGKEAIEVAAQAFADSQMIVRSTLKARGWSEKQIDMEYGPESGRMDNPHYRSSAPMRLYSLPRVLILEARPDRAEKLEKAVADRQARAAVKRANEQKKAKAFKADTPVLWFNWSKHFTTSDQAIAAATHIINKIAKTANKVDKPLIYDLKDEALGYLERSGYLVQSAISRTEEFGYYLDRQSRNLYVHWFNVDGFAVCFHSFTRLGNPQVNLNQDDSNYGNPLPSQQKASFLKIFGKTEAVKSLDVGDVCKIIQWAIDETPEHCRFGNGLASLGLPEPISSHSAPIDLVHLLKRQILIELSNKVHDLRDQEIRRATALAVKHVADYARKHPEPRPKAAKKSVKAAIAHFRLTGLNPADARLLLKLCLDEYARAIALTPLPECDVFKVVDEAMRVPVEMITIEQIDAAYDLRVTNSQQRTSETDLKLGDHCALWKEGHDHYGQMGEVIQALAPSWIKVRFGDGYESVLSRQHLEKMS